MYHVIPAQIKSIKYNILKCFAELPEISPLVVAIWYGASKPILNEYIQPLVSELKSIIPTGIYVNGHHVKIKFGLVICDTPARSLMKGDNEY